MVRCKLITKNAVVSCASFLTTCCCRFNCYGCCCIFHSSCCRLFYWISSTNIYGCHLTIVISLKNFYPFIIYNLYFLACFRFQNISSRIVTDWWAAPQFSHHLSECLQWNFIVWVACRITYFIYGYSGIVWFSTWTRDKCSTTIFCIHVHGSNYARIFVIFRPLCLLCVWSFF